LIAAINCCGEFFAGSNANEAAGGASETRGVPASTPATPPS